MAALRQRGVKTKEENNGSDAYLSSGGKKTKKKPRATRPAITVMRKEMYHGSSFREMSDEKPRLTSA